MERSALRVFLEVTSFILINLLTLIFACWVFFATGRPGLALPVLMVWVWFVANCNTTETKRCQFLRAHRGATAREEAGFQPTRYFRLRRRRGWRHIELDVDDAIEMPNVEVIPVQELGAHLPNRMCTIFEYRGQLFYGPLQG